MSSHYPGKLVVFDGTDASGKSTQIDFFKERLQKEGKKVFLIKYPRYESMSGQIIKKYLAGELGPIAEIPPEYISALYSADRYESKDELELMLNQGFIVIADRYCQSNFAYQTAKWENAADRRKFLAWQKAVDAQMPVPDAVVFLDMPREAREALLLQPGRPPKDMHEKDQEYQSRVMNLYRKMAKEEKWIHVICAKKSKGEWTLQWREAIASRIWSAVMKKLGGKS